MLDPQARLLYLEELRPPEGYKLDRAVAATFSLDLLSLLMAPLSMVFSEQREKEDSLKDPIAFLEALQRSKDRITVFCQAGRIAVPSVDSRLYSYLEPVIIEVQPKGNGVFHPKIWLLRFIAENEPVVYRLICLSRNLTFDRSWDTILSLEGLLDEKRQRGFSLNRPLSDFLRALPVMAINETSEKVSNDLEKLAFEVSRVRFKAPDGFEQIAAFIPSGIAGYRKIPPIKNFHRLLVVSPFLSEKFLKGFAEQGNDNVLISRQESLDGISPGLLDRIEADGKIFMMDEAAERPDDEEVTPVEKALMTDDLTGLHAKLYLAERGWEARIFTGSANATTSAFDGTNVEFLVELSGRRGQVGIEQFLGADDHHATLRSMLRPYCRPKIRGPESDARKQLENRLEEARRAISGAGLSLFVSPASEGAYDLELRTGNGLSLNGNIVQSVCRPVSLTHDHARDLAPFQDCKAVVFSKLSLVGLTSLIAFQLTAQVEDQQASIGFVLNLPLEGLPPDRNKRILASIISDQASFIRYLLFLLAEGSETLGTFELLVTDAGQGGVAGSGSGGLPLLEELVRASCRHPEKIDRIAALVNEIKGSDGGNTLLPDGFELIWDAFIQMQAGRIK